MPDLRPLQTRLPHRSFEWSYATFLFLSAAQAFFRSLVKYGTKPHFIASRWRSPLADLRTTGASRLGATFQVGSKFGSGFLASNSWPRNFGGRKLA
jgi:hypothetical protein